MKIKCFVKGIQTWEKLNLKLKKDKIKYNNIILINPLNLLKLKVPIIGMKYFIYKMKTSYSHGWNVKEVK